MMMGAQGFLRNFNWIFASLDDKSIEGRLSMLKEAHSHQGAPHAWVAKKQTYVSKTNGLENPIQ